MPYEIIVNKKSKKGIKDLPPPARRKLAFLLDDIRRKGPERPEYPNYSKLGKDEFHCHLGYSWVACWRIKDSKLIVEVYYVGSRESAPY